MRSSLPGRRPLARRAEKSLVRQQDRTDCGVACLASLIRYHGGWASLERLRELSGTTRRGTTLLGLYQAAGQLQLRATAYRADLETLKGFASPCVLHLLREKRSLHYVVCYGYVDGQFLIGDPAAGLRRYSPERLAESWPSRALLAVEPAPDFTSVRERRREKWRWLRRLVRDDLDILGLALVLGIGISLLGLSTAIFSQRLIDDILPEADRVRLFGGLALLTVLLLARNGLSLVRRQFLVDHGRTFNNRVIGHFFGVLLRLPQRFFFSRKVGDLIARMNDTRRLQQAVTYVLGGMTIDVLALLTAATLLVSYSTSLGLLALSSVPLYALLAALYHGPILERQQEVMAAHSATESHYVDTIQGLETIKASNREGLFAAATGAVYGFFQDRIYDLGCLGARFNFWAESVGVLLSVALLGWSAGLVLEERLQLGELVAVLQMGGILIPSARRLALTNLQLQEARVAFERMHAFTALEPEYATPEAVPSAPRVERLQIDDLSFRFPGRPRLLEGIGLEVERGEMVAVIGESGCGKTVLLRILQRFYEPEGGRITINDVPWETVPTTAWRGVLGVVPQQVKLFNGTLLDNICLGDSAAEAEAVIAFCRTCGFDRFFAAFPQGYATLLGEEGARLSGGQQQLVALARALYRRPQVLLLDEATAAMDRETEACMLDVLARVKREAAVVMVTHRVQSARRADRVYVVEQGRVRAAGAPAVLAAQDNLFARSLADLAPLARAGAPARPA